MTNHSRRALVRGLITLSLFGVSHNSASAAEELTIIVPFPAGGTVDAVARTLSQAIQLTQGLPCVVFNKPGAEGKVAARELGRDANRLALLIGNTANLSALIDGDPPALAATPISMIATQPYVALLARRWGELRSFEDFVRAHDRQSPVLFGAPGVASSEIAQELLASSGLPSQAIPYRGDQQAVMGLMRGEIDLLVDPLSSVAELIRSGSLTAVAISAPHRIASLPRVMTCTEQRLSCGVKQSWYAVFSHRQSSRTKELAAIVDDALRSTLLSEWLQSAGLSSSRLTGGALGEFILQQAPQPLEK